MKRETGKVIILEDTIGVQLVQAWDGNEIANLYRAGGWWKEEYDPKELSRLILGSFLFVVAADLKTGRAVGMGRVIADGVSDGYIQDLVVLPEYRKTGIGARIVSILVKKCVERGISWIGLIAEPGTENFYLPFGFHPLEGHTPLIFRSDE
ncbi:MAG TPA: GNAT family N-acetyltransferase [Methanoregula sp.]|nr:GNAT family N-acetyltransferase [Methanoregula sp.]